MSDSRSSIFDPRSSNKGGVPADKKLVVGLIGGMGSGKSLAAAEFAKYGARVISGDKFGHEALRQPDIKESVARRWGSEILDSTGEVDRRKLGTIVFTEERERKALEGLVFPWIERRIGEEIARAKADPSVSLVVLDAAIMLEAGWAGACDRLVYVDAPREQRLQRLAEERGWSDQEVDKREKSQWPLTEKLKRADWTLDNSGSPEKLARQVQELLTHWGVLKER
jgi:dephospho-CoA kinase